MASSAKLPLIHGTAPLTYKYLDNLVFPPAGQICRKKNLDGHGVYLKPVKFPTLSAKDLILILAFKISPEVSTGPCRVDETSI